MTQLKGGSAIEFAPWRGSWAAGGMARWQAKGGVALDQHGEEETGREWSVLWFDCVESLTW
jgi:hypothetical protein